MTEFWLPITRGSAAALRPLGGDKQPNGDLDVGHVDDGGGYMYDDCGACKKAAHDLQPLQGQGFFMFTSLRLLAWQFIPIKKMRRFTEVMFYDLLFGILLLTSPAGLADFLRVDHLQKQCIQPRGRTKGPQVGPKKTGHLAETGGV